MEQGLVPKILGPVSVSRFCYWKRLGLSDAITSWLTMEWMLSLPDCVVKVRWEGPLDCPSSESQEDGSH